MVDGEGAGEGGWKGKKGVKVVKFDRETGTKVQREDGKGLETRVSYDVGEGDVGEDDEESERKWGTSVRDWRGSVRVPTRSPDDFGEILSK